MATPDELICAMRDLWPCWSQQGWEMATEESMQLADGVTREDARRRYAIGGLRVGAIEEVGVWLRHVRPLTRQEAWTAWLESRDWEDPDEQDPVVPAEWQADIYDEGQPTWRFVASSDPRGSAVWVCGELDDGPPEDPAPAASQNTETEEGDDGR